MTKTRCGAIRVFVDRGLSVPDHPCFSRAAQAGCTPLHMAARFGAVDVMSLLLADCRVELHTPSKVCVFIEDRPDHGGG